MWFLSPESAEQEGLLVDDVNLTEWPSLTKEGAVFQQ